jgi:hypothetical protein
MDRRRRGRGDERKRRSRGRDQVREGRRRDREMRRDNQIIHHQILFS